MPSQYENSPGFELHFSDGQLIARPTAPLTDTLLIIGPALDGPTDRPVRLSQVGDATLAFGPAAYNRTYRGPNGEIHGFSGNYLIKALREAQAAGAQDVMLMRVGGTKAASTFTLPGALNAGATGTVVFTARNGGRLYNSVVAAFTSGVTSGAFTLTQPVNKRGTFTLEYKFAASGLTVLELIDKINSDPRNTTVRAALGTMTGGSLARRLQGSTTLTGGTDGTDNDDLAGDRTPYYTALTTAETGTFALLDEMEADVVLLTGISLDDAVDGNAGASIPTRSVAKAFADWLGKRTLDHPMIGVIGVRPLQNYSSKAAVNTHYAALTNEIAGTREAGWLNAGYFMKTGFTYTDANLENAIDAGGYLQVVAADAIYSDPDIGAYTDTLAASYAGSLTRLPAHEPTTHKPVNGIFGLAYQFSPIQRDYLIGGIGRSRDAGIDGGGGYVVAARFGIHGNLWVLDTTAANRKSDYRSLQIVRLAVEVQKAVKEIGFPYLGKNNTPDIRNSLGTQIKRYLDGLFEAGALLGQEGVGYTLSMDAQGTTAYSQMLGIITIDITLRPAFQIKKIKLRVRVSN